MGRGWARGTAEGRRRARRKTRPPLPRGTLSDRDFHGRFDGRAKRAGRGGAGPSHDRDAGPAGLRGSGPVPGRSPCGRQGLALGVPRPWTDLRPGARRREKRGGCYERRSLVVKLERIGKTSPLGGEAGADRPPRITGEQRPESRNGPESSRSVGPSSPSRPRESRSGKIDDRAFPITGTTARRGSSRSGRLVIGRIMPRPRARANRSPGLLAQHGARPVRRTAVRRTPWQLRGLADRREVPRHARGPRQHRDQPQASLAPTQHPTLIHH